MSWLIDFGEGTSMNIIPINDEIEHIIMDEDLNLKCSCGYRYLKDFNLFVHEAVDGRGAIEKAKEILTNIENGSTTKN